MGTDDKKNEREPSVFDDPETFVAAMAKMRAEYKAGLDAQPRQKAIDLLDPDTREAVEIALNQYEDLAAMLRWLIDEGWPTDDTDLPVLTNWIYVKSCVPCLEGNIFAPDSDATERSRTPPLVFEDVDRRLVLTTGGWYRTEQQLIQG